MILCVHSHTPPHVFSEYNFQLLFHIRNWLADDLKALSAPNNRSRIIMNKELTLTIRKLPLFIALTNFCRNGRNIITFKPWNVEHHIEKHTAEENRISTLGGVEGEELCLKKILNYFLSAVILSNFLILMPKASIWCHCVFLR